MQTAEDRAAWRQAAEDRVARLDTTLANRALQNRIDPRDWRRLGDERAELARELAELEREPAPAPAPAVIAPARRQRQRPRTDEARPPARPPAPTLPGFFDAE